MLDQENETDRRTYLLATGAITAGTVPFAGCLTDAATGTLSTRVTDNPGDIDDFESCVVSIVGMWLGPEGEEVDEEEGETEPARREYYEYDETEEADLVNLQDNTTELIDERELIVGENDFLQLDVGEVDATLTDGEMATVEVPGEASLTFNESLEVREDTRTMFTADFTPVSQDEDGGYLLQPVPEGISVTYEEE